ncbi:hypothetical protein BpHYR1_045967 [Brachionus plicatilis]|uniref:Uncharacterized protein n=1 Tax=Brachionus plicatilis TaxID=10195 RepID=A0A3M7T6M0_BRAPC|nr:hypothetical protein BpHYR1_045967 [Brachionus plicatilis]
MIQLKIQNINSIRDWFLPGFPEFIYLYNISICFFHLSMNYKKIRKQDHRQKEESSFYFWVTKSILYK